MAAKLASEANALYTDVCSGTFNIADRRKKLTRAQQLNNEALEASSSSEERASICKNLGALYFAWAKLELDSVPSWTAGPKSTHADACSNHLLQSVHFYLNAKVEGARASRPKKWLEEVEARLRKIVEWASKQSEMLGITDGSLVHKMCEEFERAIRKGNVTSQVGDDAIASLNQLTLLNKLWACNP